MIRANPGGKMLGCVWSPCGGEDVGRRKELRRGRRRAKVEKRGKEKMIRRREKKKERKKNNCYCNLFFVLLI